ncbi:type III pantothenate kinase [Gracilimonas halophila]|uniref:Type III pantothenate kinase n=1 Tax=Gracilimonas halophila TaxID=1834464 RepID=A0ABW5JJ96_9BACT
MSKIDSTSSKNTLYLDIGNSAIKGAYKDGLNWKSLEVDKPVSAERFVRWCETHSVSFSEIVVSSVRKDVLEVIKQRLPDIHFQELGVKDIPRRMLNYETIDTLGIDRFLACYGATDQTNNSVVVIDAGTAITIDFMDENNVYHGGLIAPGLAGFGEVLSQKAPALPKVDMEMPKIWPGKSTVDSLKWGQAGFYKMGIQGLLDKYEDEFGSFDLFITGGDGAVIKAMTERESRLRSFLVFEGMKRLEEKIFNT